MSHLNFHDWNNCVTYLFQRLILHAFFFLSIFIAVSSPYMGSSCYFVCVTGYPGAVRVGAISEQTV